MWRQREYRLFLSAGPPKGETGPGFNLWAGDLVLVRSHFVEDAPYSDPGHPITGKDLEAARTEGGQAVSRWQGTQNGV